MTAAISRCLRRERRDDTVSLAQRFERRLEGMVGSAFARVFKGQVEPVEIGTALQREASDKRAVMGNGQVLSPNRYRVTLGNSDYERLAPWEAQLTRSLAELVQEHLDENNLQTLGDIEVYLALDQSLHTGVFGVASRMEPQAPPRRRPYDSMSMPVVPGQPDEYLQPYGADPAAGRPAGFPAPAVSPVPSAPAPPPYTEPPRHEPPPYAEPPRYEPPPYAEPPRRPMIHAELVVDGTGQRATLKPGSNVVGRGQDCDVQLLDQGVSRKHIDVHLADGRVVLYDLGSTNGTSVNGHTVQSQELQHGDVIRIGHSRLVFHQDGS
jgi:FhaA, N-terminal domain/FHA domain